MSPEEFYEEDEPVEDVRAAFEAGVPVDFIPPAPAARNLSSSQGWCKVRIPEPDLTALLATCRFQVNRFQANPAPSQT